MDIPYIIVAGGKGLRMGTNIPKQYMEIEGKPVIFHTIKNLLLAGVKRFILVIDMQYIDYLKSALEPLDANIKYVAGGKERYESVLNGMGCLDEHDDYVGVHDSVRPLVSKTMVARLHKGIINSDISGIIPVLPVKDTIKKIADGIVLNTIDRSSIRRVGTPQIIKVKDYLDAVTKIGNMITTATDDASILEMHGFRVGVVDGEEECFKITDYLDFELFKFLLGRQNENRNRL